jgi:glycosyltransferase involved in cell wall biosynthesis
MKTRRSRDLPRCLFITAGGPDLASSRCRVLQYLPLLKGSGGAAHAWLPCDGVGWHRRLQQIAQSTRSRCVVARFPSRCEAAFCRTALEAATRLTLRRALTRAREFDLIVLQKVVPPLAWQQRLRDEIPRPILFDFDDAIHLTAEHRRVNGRRERLESLLRSCSLVVTASELNRQYARAFNRRVTLLPTPVDARRYHPGLRTVASPAAPTVGWIGSPATSRHLAWSWPALRRTAERHPEVRFHFVGARPRPDAGLPATFSPWEYATELRHLAGFTIGIMPLPPTDFARGKAGYKLLQYMALGLPAVASPHGVNAEIVAHGEDGLLAESPEEWEAALEQLLADPALRARLGAAARTKVAAHYSVEALFPRWRCALEVAAQSVGA